MRKLALAIVAILTIGSAAAQETKHKAGLRIGQSMPLGNYSEKTNGHHAEGGAAIGIFYHYEFVKGFSGTFEYMGLSNSINTDSYDKTIENSFGPGMTSSTTADPYSAGLIAVGVKFSFGEGPVTGYINPAFGQAMFNSPEFDTDLTNQNGTANMTIAETDASKAVLVLNAGAEYRISELFSLGINIGYLNMGSFELKTDMTTRDVDGSTQTNEIESYQPYSSINTTINLGFNF